MDKIGLELGTFEELQQHCIAICAESYLLSRDHFLESAAENSERCVKLPGKKSHFQQISGIKSRSKQDSNFTFIRFPRLFKAWSYVGFNLLGA